MSLHQLLLFCFLFSLFLFSLTPPVHLAYSQKAVPGQIKNPPSSQFAKRKGRLFPPGLIDWANICRE